MHFADYYIDRFQSETACFRDEPPKDLFMVCVIPSYNEPNLEATLQSLLQAEQPQKSAEIIVVINRPENSSPETDRQNRQSLKLAEGYIEKFSGKVSLKAMNFPALPQKHAGAGLARKKGMDEALHRFNRLNRPGGIISCIDADCLTDKNYFKATEDFFDSNPKARGVSVHYEHRLHEPQMTEADNLRIISYELHLRYMNQALRFIQFPHAFQTIGSAFAVRASVYASVGGMNRRKAGEDFYFLHKVIEGGQFYDLPETTIYPSARSSDRVPFGTGAAVKKMSEQNTEEYQTYALESFFAIGKFTDAIDRFYTTAMKEIIFEDCIMQYLKDENLYQDIESAKRISPDIHTFRKHFFSRFNAFKMVKYLNFAQRHGYPAKPAVGEAEKFYRLIAPNQDKISSPEALLEAYRRLEKENPKHN